MRLRLISVAATLACSLVWVGTAVGSPIPVTNASFETLPAGGLPFGGCGTGCSFSQDGIPGWTNTGATSGQFQPGSSSGNFAYFNTVPDGLTVGYTNLSTISQVVGTAVAGVTYILQVDIGKRADQFNAVGIADLRIDANPPTFATGLAPTPGNWSTFTATYTASALDNGKSIIIELNPTGLQGDFDKVRLNAVPEPATLGLLGAGLLALGGRLRARKK